MKAICLLVFIFLQTSGHELLSNKLQRWGEYDHERPAIIELALMPPSNSRSKKRCEVNHHGCEETELIQKVRTLEGLEKIGKRSTDDKFILETPLIQSYYDY